MHSNLLDFFFFLCHNVLTLQLLLGWLKSPLNFVSAILFKFLFWSPFEHIPQTFSTSRKKKKVVSDLTPCIGCHYQGFSTGDSARKDQKLPTCWTQTVPYCRTQLNPSVKLAVLLWKCVWENIENAGRKKGGGIKKSEKQQRVTRTEKEKEEVLHSKVGIPCSLRRTHAGAEVWERRRSREELLCIDNKPLFCLVETLEWSWA